MCLERLLRAPHRLVVQLVQVQQVRLVQQVHLVHLVRVQLRQVQHRPRALRVLRQVVLARPQAHHQLLLLQALVLVVLPLARVVLRQVVRVVAPVVLLPVRVVVHQVVRVVALVVALVVVRQVQLCFLQQLPQHTFVLLAHILTETIHIQYI